jgi:hypothetical protein
MGRILKRGAGAVALLLACTPTEPCACPPARTTLLVYGEVRTASGGPAASAVVRYLLAQPAGATSTANPCEFDPATSDAEPAEVRADAAGRFRSQVYSIFSPATRCLRVTAHAAGAAAESASVDGLLVPFRFSRPDSIGLVVTLR